MTSQHDTTSALAQEVSQIFATFIGEVSRYSAGNLFRLMRREGLSMPRIVAMMHLDRETTASITDICDYLNLSLGNTSHIVNQLVCDGFVTRNEDPNDRRLKHVALTAQGQALTAEVKRARVEDLAQRLEQLPTPLLEDALSVMTDIIAHLQQEAPPQTEPDTH